MTCDDDQKRKGEGTDSGPLGAAGYGGLVSDPFIEQRGAESDRLADCLEERLHIERVL